VDLDSTPPLCKLQLIKIKNLKERGPLEGSCEHVDEPSRSLKFWEVLE
jgi:hypothetical protein